LGNYALPLPWCTTSPNARSSYRKPSQPAQRQPPPAPPHLPALPLTNLQALFLPEASDYIASSPAETISLAQPVTSSPFVLGLQELAKEHQLAINVGVHEPSEVLKDAEEILKVKNTSLWIDERGRIAQLYQKVHLFDVEIEGGPVLKESNSVEKGMSILPPFETAVGRVGLLICFDVSFCHPFFHSYLTCSEGRHGSEVHPLHFFSSQILDSHSR
jgi:predicted amidohydrolase